MDGTNHLVFNIDIDQHKPENIVSQTAYCPFCERESLEEIIERRGVIWWIKNKYPVLAKTHQTVIIETDDCNDELSRYPKDHLYAVMSFGVEKWLELSESGRFASVLFYKNHGPCSGGTIRHPHMQIVGLEEYDCWQHIRPEQFAGDLIASRQGVEFNLSNQPRMGFFEFNVILDDLEKLDVFADFTQIATHYILNGFHRACKSYNLFFYRHDGKIIVKIIPRFVTSPLFVGYGIPQVANAERSMAVIQAIRQNYI